MPGLEIISAIPPVFDAYATIVLPEDRGEQLAHDPAVIELLRNESGALPWWLGYLQKSDNTDVVFPQAPRVSLYPSWNYVLVQAGPEQALQWREADGREGVLPDLIFPSDRSWLFQTLWDDDWSCVGGPRRLIDGFLTHPELEPRAREVQLGEDATPPGHVAR